MRRGKLEYVEIINSWSLTEFQPTQGIQHLIWKNVECKTGVLFHTAERKHKEEVSEIGYFGSSIRVIPEVAQHAPCRMCRSILEQPLAPSEGLREQLSPFWLASNIIPPFESGSTVIDRVSSAANRRNRQNGLLQIAVWGTQRVHTCSQLYRTSCFVEHGC